MESLEAQDHVADPAPEGRGAGPLYPPIEKGQIRILCLEPGEHGSSLKARFDVLDLDSVQRVQPDLRSCDPEGLEFDTPEVTLRNIRGLLTQHQKSYADLRRRCDGLESLGHELRSLLQQREALKRELRQDSPFATTSRGDAMDQAGILGMTEFSAECATLEKLEDDVFSVKVYDVQGLSRIYDRNTYNSLGAVARLLVGISQIKRDDMVRHAMVDGAYETLSYAWACSDFTQRLHIGDRQHEVPITKTVFDALQQLRLQDVERRLWVDALCIDQSNILERSRQISIMSRIYAAASRTIVWLGKEDYMTCQAYGVLVAHLSARIFNLDFYDSESEIPLHISRVMGSYNVCDLCGNSIPVTLNNSNQSFAAMEQLASRPWFTRLWVVQEIASARFAEVHCGAHRISWDVFSKLKSMNCELRNLCWDIEIAEDLSNEPYSPCVLLWFLIYTSRRKCSLEEDRVYAVQSITSLTAKELDGIGNEMSWRELFIRLAENCLTFRHTTSLSASKGIHFVVPHVSVLLALAPKTATDGSLPSWVPDWNRLPENAKDITGQYSYELCQEFRFGCPLRNYSNRTPLRNLNLMQCYTKQARTCLSVRGYHFGNIAEVLEGSEYPFPEQESGDEQSHSLDSSRWFGDEQQSWFYLCKGFAEKFWPPHDFDVKLKEFMLCLPPHDTLYPKAMIGNNTYWQYVRDARPLPTTRQEVFEACSPLLVDDQGKVDPHKLAIWTCGGGYNQGDLRFLRDRKLSIICAGSYGTLLGWIPLTAEVGDRICLFSGAPRPFIVKSYGDEDDSFTLLGDAWVHGLLETEITDLCSEHEADLEWIDLK